VAAEGLSAGAFCWVGLATSDPDAARPFYADLLGWRGEELPAGEAGAYTLLRRGAREVAILYRQTPEARRARVAPHWTPYILVEDADATAKRAAELGGAAVFRQAFDVLDEGRVAAIRDPTGAIASLWQPRSRAGSGLLSEPGALCWNELATDDVELAKSFYSGLLAWEYEPHEDGYTTIRSGGRPNGGMRSRQADERGAAPSWLPYFMVESAERTASDAERLGGRALAPAAGIPFGRSALIADPQGAAFAVLQSSSTRRSTSSARAKPA